FPAVGLTRGGNKHPNTYINSLVKPSGTLGTVNIATGVVSSTGPGINVQIKSAITLIKEMAGNVVKFFPMKGLETKAEYKAVAQACAEEESILHATGRIHLDNFEEIISIALQAGVKQIIPHVYSSIIDKDSGKTRVRDVDKLYHMMKKAVDRHG